MALEIVRVIRAKPGERGLKGQRTLIEMVDRRRVATRALVRLRERTQPIGTAGVDADRLVERTDGLRRSCRTARPRRRAGVRFTTGGVGANACRASPRLPPTHPYSWRAWRDDAAIP
jgi:hypothetical protein